MGTIQHFRQVLIGKLPMAILNGVTPITIVG